jgi:hypothetical protein
MIGVSVRHEDPCETGAALDELSVDRGEVPWLADPCVDQRTIAVRSDEQICVVALARHRTGIVRGEPDRMERHGDVRHRGEALLS